MKEFPVEVILSITHSRLLCNIEKVYEILDYITGDKLFTHQLPRAARTCAPWVLRGLPQLMRWNHDNDITAGNYEIYIEMARKEFGSKLLIKPMPREDWTHINPIEEAKAMVGDDRVIVLSDEPERQP
jgi:hypothetical protein